MKAYTDLEQSKKLAEILPIESADMCFNISQRSNMPPLMTPYSKFKEFFDMDKTPDFLIPCWSLAALLDVLPDEVGDNYYLTLDKEDKEYCCCYEDNNDNSFRHCFSDNPVDACYKMILKLHEQKLL